MLHTTQEMKDWIGFVICAFFISIFLAIMALSVEQARKKRAKITAKLLEFPDNDLQTIMAECTVYYQRPVRLFINFFLSFFLSFPFPFFF